MLYKLPIKVSSEKLDSSSGFTLIEVLVALVIIGVLSAIAAPSWLGFVARQRLNKANDSVFSALQEAQRQAKKTKFSYSVSLKIDNKVAKIVVHPDSIEPSKVDDKRWKLIGEGLEINSNQIVVGTNLTNKNTGKDKDKENPIKSLAGYKTIAFDYTGALPKDATTPLKIVLATPKSQNSTQPSNLKRCVIVETLIGGMRTATDEDCDKKNTTW
ncbi:MAG: Tfp pilus assembly protein FimT/FimU [Rivularia sp. (in: cyanobacteria)]